MTLLTVSLALAGYGDPVAGIPSHDERLLHLWTNAARVAPEEFEEDYNNGYEPCSFEDFSNDEQTPKPPLYIDLDLTEVARVHSIDMKTNGCFQHESCDGTDTFERIAAYYDDTSFVGENIAMGSTNMRYSVMGMWMCSTDGHRANIMSGDWNELGAGVDAEYQTQDFGAGQLELGEPPVRMAVDDGETFYADWGDDDAPRSLELVLEEESFDFALEYGAEEQGIYVVEVADVDEEPCRGWSVAWETASGESGRFPADGRWLVGTDCEGSDDGEDYLPGAGPGLFDDVGDEELEEAMLEDLALTGCAVSPGPTSGIAGLIGGLFVLRRRR
ncbi:MAG: CAP domain-containing protein [Myxococcota bacterium]